MHACVWMRVCVRAHVCTHTHTTVHSALGNKCLEGRSLGCQAQGGQVKTTAGGKTSPIQGWTWADRSLSGANGTLPWEEVNL